jgi:hypothetical protein
VHFREILSGYFLFSRFDWSIFVTQLVAKHMKEIIAIKIEPLKKRNNEIITQYLTDATVEFPVSFVLGVSMLSDVMSKLSSKMVVQC